MARISARDGRVLLAATSGAEASDLNFVGEWGLSAATEQIDVTAMGDTGKTSVRGLPAQSGTFSGYYDQGGTNTLYDAAVDGLARKFYLYANRNAPTDYWYGTVTADAEFGGAVGGAVTVSGSWAAASGIYKKP